MRQYYWLFAILFRIVLPCVMVTSVLIRPTITSYVYLVMACYMPFFSIPTSKDANESFEFLLKTLVIISFINTTFVLSFYFALYFKDEQFYDIEYCDTIEKALRTVGIVPYDDLPIKDALSWILPEHVMLGLSVLLLVGFKRFQKENSKLNVRHEITKSEKHHEQKNEHINFLRFGKYFTCLMLCLSGVLKPNIFGGIYYLIFLGTLTYWACNHRLNRNFARFICCLAPLEFLQLTLLFLYQLHYVQESSNLNRSSLWIRLLALVPLTTYKDCSDPRLFTFHHQSKVSYAMFFSVFVLYTVSILTARLILRAEDGLLGIVKACFRREQIIQLKWMMMLDKLKEDLRTKKSTLKDEELPVEKAITMLDDILRFIFSISTLLANLMMMVWAIAYVGTKSLLLLVIANLVWLMPARKRVMLLISPLIAVYISFMLLAAYVYSLDVTSSEIPSKFGQIDLRSGIEKLNEQKWVELFIKSLIGVIIGVAVRQLLQEKSMQRQEIELLKSGAPKKRVVQAESKKVHFTERFRLMVFQFLSIWWIWAVIITMIWMEFWSFSSHFRIGFVGLAFVFLLTFQFCPFKYWKKFLNIFWWIVVVYSMFHLFVIYAFQLDDLRYIMLKALTMEQYAEFGCSIWKNSKERFEALVNPLFLQIAVVVQQNYLQKEFNKISEPQTPESLAQKLNVIETYGHAAKATVIMFNRVKDIVFALLEVHLLNFTIFFGWLMCVYDMCAVFAPFVLLLTISCIAKRKYSKIIIYIMAGLVQVFVILRLVYMTMKKGHSKWEVVGYYTRNGKSYNVTLNTADWIGFHESKYGTTYADFQQLIWCFAFILLVTLDRVVTIRMENYRKTRNIPNTDQAVMFPDITYKNSHESVGNMLKFLANYGFYKLGCEITMIYASILMTIRMDAVAIILSFWLMSTFSMSRVQLQKYWIFQFSCLAILIPLQYLTTLGLWPSMFYKSSTEFWTFTDLRLRIQQFCHLPNVAYPPIKEKISQDFMLILFASRQWLGFKRERKSEEQDLLAGSNENVCHLIDVPNQVNPIPDFTTHISRNLDLFNHVVFTSWFYVSLVTVFLAGTMRPSMYSLGFIFGASAFLWIGSDLFLISPEKIMRRWNLLIAYNILVMLAKTISQVVGCVLVYHTDLKFNCRAIKYFSIGCVDYYGMTKNIPDMSKSTLCPSKNEGLGLEWDCLCFFFLLCQQRIFKSFYFFHIVNDAKAHVILADRGVEVIAELKRTKKERFDQERVTIENNIKAKLEKIKANASKIAEIRKGNYSHFVEVTRDTDIPLLPPKEEIEEDYQSYDPMPLTEYFGLFFSTDIDTVLEITDIRSRRKKAAIRKALGKPPEKKTTQELNSQKASTKTPIKVIRFIWGIFESSIVSLTEIINRTSLNIRLVLSEIEKDIDILKEKTNFTVGKRLGPNQIWSPTGDYKTILNKERKQLQKKREMQYSIYIKLLKAIWFAINAHSEWLCYMMLILYQALLNDIISLPLILMTFCWGSLSVPRPTKMFWIVNFTYCLVMVLIKHVMDLEIAPWGVDETKFAITFALRFLGLYNRMKFLTMVLLMVLFFHRLVLRQLGLWKTTFYRSISTLVDGDYYLKDGKLETAKRKNQDRNQKVLEIKTTPITLGDYFPASLYQGLSSYARTIRLYVQRLISPPSTQVPVDVYTPMFLCDLVNLLLLVFFFGHFTSDPQDTGVLDYVSQNRVPISFLAFVISYMLFMMIDRALYVRKNRFGKLAFHIMQVFGYHMWFFIANPMTNKTAVADSMVLQIFYVFKCLYFVFSAYQIRSGYPTIISYHYLWHGYSLLNRFGYKLFRSIPYFLEIRCLLDWICIDTCLKLDAWFKMEDVTQSLFDKKCQQEFEAKWSSPGGQRRNRTSKILVGSLLFSFLVLSLIFPFLLFSAGTNIGITSRPDRIRMELFMGRTMPIFQATASFKTIGRLTQNEYENISSTFNNIENSQIFADFTNEDTVVYKWPRDSLHMWTVSPGTKLDLLRELQEDDYFVIRLEITYKHKMSSDGQFVKMFGQDSFLFPLPDEDRQNLINMIKGQDTETKPITLPLIFPKFLKIRRDGSPEVLNLMELRGTETQPAVESDDYVDLDDDTDLIADDAKFRDILLSLNTTDGKKFWWQVREKCELNDENYVNYLANLVHNDCNNLVIYVFNEKVFAGSLSYLTKGGILGLYLIYFMVILGLIRSIFRADVNEIWISDMPNVDLLLRKCLEIYVARDMKNFELEKEIYEEIVAIMRSREVVIKLTRYEDNQYDPTYMGI